MLKRFFYLKKSFYLYSILSVIVATIIILPYQLQAQTYTLLLTGYKIFNGDNPYKVIKITADIQSDSTQNKEFIDFFLYIKELEDTKFNWIIKELSKIQFTINGDPNLNLYLFPSIFTLMVGLQKGYFNKITISTTKYTANQSPNEGLPVLTPSITKIQKTNSGDTQTEIIISKAGINNIVLASTPKNSNFSNLANFIINAIQNPASIKLTLPEHPSRDDIYFATLKFFFAYIRNQIDLLAGQGTLSFDINAEYANLLQQINIRYFTSTLLDNKNITKLLFELLNLNAISDYLNNPVQIKNLLTITFRVLMDSVGVVKENEKNLTYFKNTYDKAAKLLTKIYEQIKTNTNITSKEKVGILTITAKLYNSLSTRISLTISTLKKEEEQEEAKIQLKDIIKPISSFYEAVFTTSLEALSLILKSVNLNEEYKDQLIWTYINNILDKHMEIINRLLRHHDIYETIDKNVLYKTIEDISIYKYSIFSKIPDNILEPINNTFYTFTKLVGDIAVDIKSKTSIDHKITIWKTISTIYQFLELIYTNRLYDNYLLSNKDNNNGLNTFVTSTKTFIKQITNSIYNKEMINFILKNATKGPITSKKIEYYLNIVMPSTFCT